MKTAVLILCLIVLAGCGKDDYDHDAFLAQSAAELAKYPSIVWTECNCTLSPKDPLSTFPPWHVPSFLDAEDCDKLQTRVLHQCNAYSETDLTKSICTITKDKCPFLYN